VDDGLPEQRELASLEAVVMQNRAHHAHALPGPGLPTLLEMGITTVGWSALACIPPAMR